MCMPAWRERSRRRLAPTSEALCDLGQPSCPSQRALERRMFKSVVSSFTNGLQVVKAAFSADLVDPELPRTPAPRYGVRTALEPGSALHTARQAAAAKTNLAKKEKRKAHSGFIAGRIQLAAAGHEAPYGGPMLAAAIESHISEIHPRVVVSASSGEMLETCGAPPPKKAAKEIAWRPEKQARAILLKAHAMPFSSSPASGSSQRRDGRPFVSFIDDRADAARRFSKGATAEAVLVKLEAADIKRLVPTPGVDEEASVALRGPCGRFTDIVAVRSLGRGVLPDGWVEAATTSYEEMRDKTQVQLAEMQCYSL